MNLKEDLGPYVAKSAFKDNCHRCVGHYGEIEIVGDAYDIYIKGVSERKLSYMLKKFPVTLKMNRATGEAWGSTTDLEIVLETLDLLGVKRRRQLSDETKAMLRERMRKINKKDDDQPGAPA